MLHAVSRYRFQLLGLLLILPWLIVPRPPRRLPQPARLAATPLPSAKAATGATRAVAPLSSSLEGKREDDWRRTTRGWERKRSWRIARSGTESGGWRQLHPLLLAALQTLICLGALLAAHQPRSTPSR